MALNRLSTAEPADAGNARRKPPNGFASRPDPVERRLHLSTPDNGERISFRASALLMLAASIAGWVAVYGLLNLML